MKRLFLFLIIVTISLGFHAQINKFNLGEESIYLPKIKGYQECAKSKFSKSYTDVLMPEKTKVMGFYLTNMAYSYPELSFFHEGINDCILFMVSDFLENEVVERPLFKEIIAHMDSVNGPPDKGALEQLKKSNFFNETFLPESISLVDTYSIDSKTRTYVFVETVSDSEIRCIYSNFMLINKRAVEFLYSLTLNNESSINLAQNNNNYFLKAIFAANNIQVSNELKSTLLVERKSKSNDSFFTKDGYDMGSRQSFIQKATGGVENLEVSGIKIDANKVWECITYKKIPTLNSDEIFRIVKKDIAKLFPTDENEVDELMSCVGDGFSIGESYVGLCVERYIKADFTEEESRRYCECEYEKLKDKVINYRAFKKYYSEIGDEHKDSYNEVILPCRNLVEKNKSNNSYVPGDIEGFSEESIIKLTPSGTTFKIKLVIDGVSRYFIFDSGASELIINSDLEKELLDKKLITKSDYIEPKSFAIADGSIVNAKGVVLDNIVIGGYKVSDVVAYITDEGGMLCGMGLMNKFKNWEFDKEQSMLTIYK
jgi:hypothetical protein